MKKWTYETCMDAAQHCMTRSDFKRKYPASYKAARENGWLDDYTWLKVLRKKAISKWTYDLCKQAASKFTTLKDFRTKLPGAYNTARKNGWIKEYAWLKVCNNHGYWTYERCLEEAKKCKTITEFAKKCGAALFRAKENNWIADYTWFVDGKQLSAEKHRKWNYDTCYELAKQCSKKSEMKDKNQRAYEIALKNGWFDDYDWFDKGIDIYGKCDNVYAYIWDELKTIYIGRTISPKDRDWAHIFGNSCVNRFSKANNVPVPKMQILRSNLTIKEGLYLEDLLVMLFKNSGEYNVLNTAKTGIESGAIGTLKDKKWTYEACFEKATKYKTISEFEKGNASACHKARKKGWLKDYTWFLKPAKELRETKSKWTYEACFEEAKKYKSLKDFRKKSPAAYNIACKNKWQYDYTWLKTVAHKSNYWTYERCYDEAKKYKTRTKFQKGSGTAYDKALKNKWLDDYTWFASSATAFKWNYDNCYNEAKKYVKLSDFRKKGGAAYGVSRINGWIKDYTWLIKKDISQKTVLQISLDGKIIAKYNGVREACRLNGFKGNSSISQCCNGKLKQAYGYIWKYQ